MKFLKIAYWNSIFPFICFFLLSALILLSYRIQIYLAIQSLYSDFSSLSFLQYLGHSFLQDSAMLLFFSLLFLLFLISLANWIKTKIFFCSFLLFLQSFVLILGIDFFKVYETSFQKSYISSENFTNTLGNIIQSVTAEISLSGYIQLAVSLSVILACAFLILLLSQNKFFSALHQPSKKFSILPLFFVFPFFIGFLFSFFQTNISSSEKKTAQLNEFSINPIAELLSREKKPSFSAFLKKEKEIQENQNQISPSFNTRSLEIQVQTPSLNLLPKGKKYNIILYAFESTSYQYLKLKINEQWVMKTWNTLEKNSIHFTNHYTHYPLSANALFSVLTSIYDPNSKESAIERYPNLPVKTLPEVLKENGYKTAFIHTGFLEYAKQIHFLKHRKFDLMLEFKELIKTPGYTKEVGWGADERTMIHPAIDFIKKNPKAPFFLALFPVNPHHPYSIPSKKYEITGEIPSHLTEKKKSWNKYLNSLHFADAALGELIDRLEKEGLMENTLLILYADHGEAFYQHRMNYNHPFFLYEENVHVPFLIYNKNLILDTYHYKNLSRHIDIAPTILDLIGIKVPQEYQGLPLFKPHAEQMALLHASWKDDYRGFKDGKWKYIRKTVNGIEELYDLEKDPDEQKNLSLQHPEITKRYRQKLEESSIYKDQLFEVLHDSKKMIQAKQK